MSFLDTLKTRLSAAFHPDLNFERKWVVTISESEVSCTRPNGKVEFLKWDDLEIVAIETTDEGPYVADVFWYLAGKQSGCVVPLGATGEDQMIKRLQSLTGFDNEAFSQAMASTSNRRFTLWRKNDAT
jgi:hypothetical protein